MKTRPGQPSGHCARGVARAIATCLAAGALGVASTAAGAQITLNGGSLTTGHDVSGLTFNLSNGAALTFDSTATAVSDKIISTGSNVTFKDSSSAGASTINLDGSGLTFNNQSSAGSASISATNASVVSFYDNSDGGTSAIGVDATSILDISASTGSAGNGVVNVGSISGSGTVFLGGEQLSVGGDNQSTTFSGLISDCDGGDCNAFPLGMATTGGILTKVGTGTLTLTGANDYTGGTFVDGGVLNVGADDSLGAAGTTLTLNGGALQYGAAFTLDPSRSVVLGAGGGTIDVNGFSGIAIGSVISGSGGLTIAGGALTLTGADTYTGASTIDSGATLALSAGGSIAHSSDVVVDGTLDISGTSAGASIVSLDGGGAVTLGGQTLTLTGASGSFGGDIQGSGGLTISGGTETLAGKNGYSGPTTISGGAALALSGAGSIASSSNVLDGGTFDISGTTGGASILTLEGAGQVLLGGETLTLTEASGTFSGGIQGSGGLTISGGTETLTGVNQFTGLTTVGAGATLALVGSGSIAKSGDPLVNGVFDISGASGGVSVVSLSGSGQVSLGANTLTLTGAQDVFSGVVQGTGGLTIAAGAEILTGASTYTGGTQISAGTLQIGNGGTTGSIVGNVVDNGTLAFDRSDTVTFAGAVSGSGALAQAGSGTTVLTGASTFTGGVQISAGTLQIGNGGTTGSIAGDVTDNGTLAFEREDTLTYAGSVSGSGALQQRGSGELVFTGTSQLTGPTAVLAGTLTVEGSLAFSPVTVASGGALGGFGTVGSTTVNSGGLLAPGASIGTLHVNGDLTLAPGSTYLVDVAPTAADKVQVSGNASLGGKLSALFGAGHYGAITQYAVVSSSGALTGSFSGLSTANTPAGYLTRLSYDAHDAYLTLLSESAALSPGSSSIHASIRTNYIEDERLIRDAVVGHLTRPDEPLSVWAEGFGAAGEMVAQDGLPSLHHEHYGAVGGVDAALGQSGVRAGIGAAYTAYSLYTGAHVGQASGQAGHVVAYAAYSSGAKGLQLRGGGELGWGDDNVSRHVALLSETDRNSQTGRTAQTFIDAAWRVRGSAGVVEPHAGLAWVQATTGAFQETGGTFSSLSGPSASSHATFGTLGVRAMLNQVVFAGVAVRPHVDVAWRHAFEDSRPVQNVNFVTGGEAETVEGLPVVRNAAMVRAGVDVALARNARMTVAYDGLLSDKAWDHAGVVRVSWRF